MRPNYQFKNDLNIIKPIVELNGFVLKHLRVSKDKQNYRITLKTEDNDSLLVVISKADFEKELPKILEGLR